MIARYATDALGPTSFYPVIKRLIFGREGLRNFEEIHGYPDDSKERILSQVHNHKGRYIGIIDLARKVFQIYDFKGLITKILITIQLQRILEPSAEYSRPVIAWTANEVKRRSASSDLALFELARALTIVSNLCALSSSLPDRNPPVNVQPCRDLYFQLARCCFLAVSSTFSRNREGPDSFAICGCQNAVVTHALALRLEISPLVRRLKLFACPDPSR